MAVQVIKRQELAPRRTEDAILRTCCYVRVSTTHEAQEDSFEAQRSHYEALIKGDPGMAYAGTYSDEGVSGTGTAHREGFRQMLADAERHMFDQVLTKSISRFGRNTLDTLQAVRRLKDLGIGVRFEKEGVWTLDCTGEILLVILSSLAQQESQSISENIKMGIRYRFQEGKHFVNCSRFLGYDKAEGQLVINPGEATVVRRVYSLFLNGYGPDMIAAQLAGEGAPTGVGGSRWYASTVRYILSNEKYMGDLRLQKTVVTNFLTHRTKKNTGEADQYYVENSHAPIVPRDVFAMAGAEAARRRAVRLAAGCVRNGGIKYGSRRALNGRCRCECGARMALERYTGDRWICPDCGFSFPDDGLRAAVLEAFGRLPQQGERLRTLLARADADLDAMPASGGGSADARVAALFRKFHILTALDWLENQGQERPGAGRPCRTLEQFVAMTRPCPLTAWSDDAILRFMEGVDFIGGRPVVRFRAGVAVRIEAPGNPNPSDGKPETPCFSPELCYNGVNV